MFPRTQEEGEYLEKLCHFAARRARALVSHEALWAEVEGATPEKRAHFLHYILQEEWSLDVAEMTLFVYDIEGVPSWLITELLRHRFIARDFSFEQRSKRAIQGQRIPVLTDMGDEGGQGTVIMQELARHSIEAMTELRHLGYPAQKLRYASLEGSETGLVCAANARALHHLFTLRGGQEIGGDGKAAPEFQELVRQMWGQAKAVCPNLFATLLKS